MSSVKPFRVGGIDEELGAVIEVTYIVIWHAKAKRQVRQSLRGRLDHAVQIGKTLLWTTDHVDMPGRHVTSYLDCEFGSLKSTQVADPKNFQVALITIQLPHHGTVSSLRNPRVRLRMMFAKVCSLTVRLVTARSSAVRGRAARLVT
jgi:hypothetical protein